MPLDPADLLSRQETDRPVRWDDQQLMLYALAVGMGRDPLDRRELPFVYEGGGLKVLPSFASVLARTRLLDDCGWDYARVLHGAERIVWHRPLLDSGELRLASRVSRLRDLGEGRGAHIALTIEATTARGERPLFTVERTLIARGDGGFGGPRERWAVPPAMPARAADLSCTLRTRRDQALLYRLCGDRNPLHADPALARRLGLPAPILHGLCTWGVACRAILRTICEYDPTLLRSFEGRFSAPALPGDTLTTLMWQQANLIHFRVLAEERNTIVLDHGRCELVD